MIQTNLKFNEMDLKELQTVTKKCCDFGKNNNAVIHNKNLISLYDITGAEALKNFYFELDYYNNDYLNGFYLYEDYNFICSNISHVGSSITMDELIKAIENYSYKTYEGLKQLLIEKENKNQFINVVEIKILETGGENQELINHYIKYRNDYYARREAEEQEKTRIREEKEQEKIKIKQLEIEKLIADTEQQILNNEKIINKTITIVNKNNEFVETSLLLYLFKQNNIDVPLKTQGWVNNSLCSIQNQEGLNKYTYSYTGRNSTVIRNYILELVEVIKNKNNVALSSEELETKQAEQEKQEYINNIKTIDFKKESNIFRIEMDMSILKKKNGSYDFNIQEQETLVKRIYKALKYDNIESKLKDYLLLENLSNREYKSRITLGKNNINISVIGIKDNDKVKLYFKKWYDNKDDVYINIETL